MFTHCPKCDSVGVIPIAYGKPGPEMYEASKFGLIHLAGCVINDNFDKHCKACGHEWFSNSQSLGATARYNKITLSELNGFLHDLKVTLDLTIRSIEHEYMYLGLQEYDSDMTSLISCMGSIHESWSHFAYRLETFCGDLITVIDDANNFVASYSSSTARIYLLKHISSTNSCLNRIAQASYKLGWASVDKLRNTDELKNASIELINARQNFEDMWQSFSRGFTTYRE